MFQLGVRILLPFQMGPDNGDELCVRICKSFCDATVDAQSNAKCLRSQDKQTLVPTKHTLKRERERL